MWSDIKTLPADNFPTDSSQATIIFLDTGWF